MRTAITVAIPHYGPAVFLSGPSVPIDTQKTEIKKLKGIREHPEYAEVQIWESGSGIVSRVKLDKPKAATPAPAAEDPHAPPADTKRKK